MTLLLYGIVHTENKTLTSDFMEYRYFFTIASINLVL
jgi:hypothetical protein